MNIKPLEKPLKHIPLGRTFSIQVLNAVIGSALKQNRPCLLRGSPMFWLVDGLMMVIDASP